MVDLLSDRRQAIAELCRRFGVRRLDVFGSALRDDFRPGDSDINRVVQDRGVGSRGSTPRR